MNTDPKRDDALTLELLDTMERDERVSQRHLARNMGVALGLANSYLKRCVRKGHDQSVIHHIIACLEIRPDQHWVEIGPGQGALTEPLLRAGAHLDVVELDRDLVALLKNKIADQAHFQIHSADALKFDFSSLAKEGERVRIVGNLPYNISTPLMFHLLTSSHCIEDMHFMLQKEVVERLCAEPGNKQYGRLSVMIQYHCEVAKLFNVGPESFNPAPKVESAEARLRPHSLRPVLVTDEGVFSKIVAQARDLCDQILDISSYLSVPPAMSRDMLDRAALAYFVDI